MKMRRINYSIAEIAKCFPLYMKAFPAEERAPFLMLASKAGDRSVDFWGFYDDKNFLGFMYVVNHVDLSYVFYFAICEKYRGQGYGSRALKLCRRRYAGRRFFLAIEQLDKSAENYFQRKSRRDFYIRCKMSPLGMKVQEGSVTYDLLGIGGTVSSDEYSALIGEYLGKMKKSVVMHIVP